MVVCSIMEYQVAASKHCGWTHFSDRQGTATRIKVSYRENELVSYPDLAKALTESLSDIFIGPATMSSSSSNARAFTKRTISDGECKTSDKESYSIQ